MRYRRTNQSKEQREQQIPGAAARIRAFRTPRRLQNVQQQAQCTQLTVIDGSTEFSRQTERISKIYYAWMQNEA